MDQDCLLKAINFINSTLRNLALILNSSITLKSLSQKKADKSKISAVNLPS